jgi:hypothetical protein
MRQRVWSATHCLMSNHWHVVLWPRKAGGPVKVGSVDQQHAGAALA